MLDNDKYSRTDVVGEVSFALEDFDITTNLEIFADIVQNKKVSFTYELPIFVDMN